MLEAVSKKLNAIPVCTVYCVRHEFLPISKNKNYAKMAHFWYAPTDTNNLSLCLSSFELDFSALHHQTELIKLSKEQAEKPFQTRHCASLICTEDSPGVGIDTGELGP